MSTNCVSYYRTSSLKNVGEGKDSLKRQKSVVHSFCKNNGYGISNEFYETMSGDNEILSRPVFNEMMNFCDSNDIKTIIFENTTRFSRDHLCSETGYLYLKDLGYTLISSENPESWLDDSPTSVLIRRVLSCISDFEKSTIIHKLNGSRIRKRSYNKNKGYITRNGSGKCEGRKSHLELNPELESLLKKYSKTMSVRKISSVLESEHSLKVSKSSIPNLLKEIDFKKKEERNRKRRNSYGK
jgi:DNA invertase Pin-like site-specific DNA recombinase